MESWEEKGIACSCGGLVIDEKFNRFPHSNFPFPLAALASRYGLTT